jgi:hypothetical protein
MVFATDDGTNCCSCRARDRRSGDDVRACAVGYGAAAAERHLYRRSPHRSVSGIREALGGVLIEASRGLYVARAVNGVVTVDRLSIPIGAGFVSGTWDIPGGGVLIRTDRALFVAHVANGTVVVEPASNADVGYVAPPAELTDGGLLIAADKGLFLAHMAKGAAVLDRVSGAATGRVFQTLDFPDHGVLIRAEKGWFLARAVHRRVVLRRAGITGTDTGAARVLRVLPSGVSS